MTKYLHDFNEPERGFTHQVIRTNPKIDGAIVGGEYKKFSRNGTIEITDSGILDEARKTIRPTDATVTRVRKDHPADRGHTYTFSVPAMPWHKYDELGRKVDEDVS